jgi:predicted transposase YbfD/YdcC
VAVSPEEIGLCGCWQVIAVERTSYDLGQPGTPPTVEVGYYASSVTVDERTPAQMGEAIRGHWSAIENGTHYRRDVTLGEDACRVADRNAAAVLASLRNLANGLYELERAAERTPVDTLRSWCQQQTFSTAWRLLQR